MNTLSVKELRQDLPRILKALDKGTEFEIIYHSKPVGKLVPLHSKKTVARTRGIYELLEEPMGEIKLRKNSVELIREERR